MRIKFLTPLRDTVAHADGMITLRCEVCRPKADVQWLRNGVEVVPGRRFSVRADGVERSLTIHRLTAEDAGEYVCESLDDRTVATLTVESKQRSESDGGVPLELRSPDPCPSWMKGGPTEAPTRVVGKGFNPLCATFPFN